jgi:regulator of sirC expression with transglutaminase-like and TPR domain
VFLFEGGAAGPALFLLSCGEALVITEHLVQAFTRAALSPDPDLAVAAFLIARLEHPRLDAGPYLNQLDVLGREARQRVAAAEIALDAAPPGVDPRRYARVMALNDYLFGELRFVGNDIAYSDPRNSCLNDVLDRRTGIPITLALLYMEVARRAGLAVEGVNFPGHFLLRCPAGRTEPGAQDLIIDAYHGGALLSRDQLRAQAGEAAADDDDPAAFDRRLLPKATKPQILIRMLHNLKRVYVGMHSFPQARDVTALLVSIDPSALGELRDRGLLAYHMNDFSAALRDLLGYLERTSGGPADESDRDDHAQIWEHVKTLRKRMASLN